MSNRMMSLGDARSTYHASRTMQPVLVKYGMTHLASRSCEIAF